MHFIRFPLSVREKDLQVGKKKVEFPQKNAEVWCLIIVARVRSLHPTQKCRKQHRGAMFTTQGHDLFAFPVIISHVHACDSGEQVQSSSLSLPSRLLCFCHFHAPIVHFLFKIGK